MAERPLELHATDVTSLVFGIAFAGLAFAWLLVETGVVSVAALGVALPVLLVAAGVTGLVASWRRGRGTGLDPGSGYGTGSS